MSKTRVLVDEQLVVLEVEVERAQGRGQGRRHGHGQEVVNTAEWERVGVKVKKIVQPVQLQRDLNLTIAISGLR